MDLFGIGSTVQGLVNLGTGIMNYKEQKKAREENMAFQREQFDYLKQQNQLQQTREDTAVQRKMQDLRDSGLNPLQADATGGASTGATGATTSFSGADAAQMETGLLDGLSIEADSLYNLMGAKNGLAQQQAQTDLLQQEKLNKEQDILESQSRITNQTEDTNLKKSQQKQIAEQNKKIREETKNIGQNTKNMQKQFEKDDWDLKKSKHGNIRTTDAPSRYTIGPGGISFDENSGLIRNNPALNAIGKITGAITNSINDGLDSIGNWGKKKYRQMRGKAK